MKLKCENKPLAKFDIHEVLLLYSMFCNDGYMAPMWLF